MNLKHITYEKIEIGNILEKAHSPMAGGIVLFSGEVRNHHKGKDVSKISYEAHEEMAETMMEQILNDAISLYGLHHAFAIHRLGDVGISESAVVVVTAHSHRKNAYEANQFIIDKIKAKVPIWKKEIYTDGSHYWGTQ
jgi:molybdopterin synthase catalytic subunit